jgi:hypothetical protein
LPRDGGLAGPVLALLAVGQPLGFAVPMLIGTSGAALVFILALLIGPETRSKVLVPQLTLVSET